MLNADAVDGFLTHGVKVVESRVCKGPFFRTHLLRDLMDHIPGENSMHALAVLVRVRHLSFFIHLLIRD